MNKKEDEEENEIEKDVNEDEEGDAEEDEGRDEEGDEDEGREDDEDEDESKLQFQFHLVLSPLSQQTHTESADVLVICFGQE